MGLVVALVFPLIAVLATSSPASATDWVNCTKESRAITWQSGEIAGYARARVYWNECHSSTSFLITRNNAVGIRLSLNAGVCSTVNQVGFNVSNIEGFDLGKKYLDCVENQNVTKYFDIRTPGFTYGQTNWYWENYVDRNFPEFDEPWNRVGTSTWGD